MLPILAKPIDLVTLWLATRTVGANGAVGSRPEATVSALEKLEREADDFFAAPSQTPEIERSARKISESRHCVVSRFEFASAFPSPWPRNNTVHGTIFLCPTESKQHPTVLVLHGWNHGGYQFLYYDRVCRWLARKRVNCVVIELPYHGHRRPTGAHEPKNFLTDDFAANALAVRQAVSDARQTLRGLRADGFDNVGLWGISLGGWIGGLVLGLEERVRFASLTTPAARVDEIIRTLPIAAPLRQRLERDAVPLDDALRRMKFLLPSERQPRLEPSRIFLMESLHDQFVTPASVEELWEKWNRPRIARYHEGHISILISPRALSDLAAFLQRQN
jgi:pimeloyl-ACP methyl ester carboxylesterase